MIHDIISSLEPSLQNAAMLSAVAGLNSEESTQVIEFITEVLNSISTEDLKDRDKITYIKLWAKIRDKTPKTINLDDYVTPDKQRLIDRLQRHIDPPSTLP